MLVMMTGEFNFEDNFLPEDGQSVSPLLMSAAIAFFVVFLLFIYIVLSNLIIGLAVNVTEKDLEASEYLRTKNWISRFEEIDRVLTRQGLRVES